MDDLLAGDAIRSAATLALPRGALEADPEALWEREYIVTNGLGGFASATVSGALTRRYHGVLIAAHPAPLGRLVLLSHMMECVRLPDGRTLSLGRVDARDDRAEDVAASLGCLASFELELGLPVWRFQIGGATLEKRLFMPQHQNIVYLSYRLDQGAPPMELLLRPALDFRPMESSVAASPAQPYRFAAEDHRYEVSCGPELPVLRLTTAGHRHSFTLTHETRRELHYRTEARRGYDSRGTLWSPGFFTLPLQSGDQVTFVAGSEPWRIIDALQPGDALAWEKARRRRLIGMAPPALRQAPQVELVLAADTFVMTPVGRVADMARARASGDEVRSVIAGYHWFTDWGRDTMISLEGLTLCTGRPNEAGWILREFAQHIHKGLIPNMFPEGRNTGLYHTADATLWFFHALHRYLLATGDDQALGHMLPKLREIIDQHRRGTLFGIAMDPDDGLLRQGAEGYQLTWMDAKVDDWVVTPRRGKAVEINALWYNALCLTAGWVARLHGEAAAAPYRTMAERTRASFNERFWCAACGHLYDVVDGEQGDDPACRPNQLFAIALDHPVLNRQHWAAVLQMVEAKLLTPLGLRSLAPDHPDFKQRYFGDLRARDAAYHQGTVWGWLIGPYIDAYLRLHPDDRAGARRRLDGFWRHLQEAGIGTISEVFDAEPPFTPRGCIAQAWSVAEVLRCWLATEPLAEDQSRSTPS